MFLTFNLDIVIQSQEFAKIENSLCPSSSFPPVVIAYKTIA